jgi:hypothetical protein
MDATIRISAEKAGPPKGGFAGAIAGGTDPGDTQYVEVSLTDATGGDVAVMTDRSAGAYRLAFLGEHSAEGVIGDPIPFPQAGDPHPFERPEEEATPESQVGMKPWVATSEDELDALPIGSIALDVDFDGYRKAEAGWARGLATYSSERLIKQYPPALVVYVPGKAE